MVALQVIDPVTQQQSQTTPPTATVSPIMAPAPPPAMGPLTRERRRKAHGLYFHSSPPKVLQMNNQNLQRDNDGRAREVIKPSNIRIWLHQKQLAKLTKVIWTGQGMRLRTETSHHPKMKRFLECVPHVMGVIKDIHQAVVDNDPETLREKMADPTPRIVLTSKDSNGLTPLHKAAGLAHTQIVEYILSIWPSLSSDEDHTGKTPLHWAASAKNNARSFNLLVQAGADEAALDHKGKLAEYYKNKPSDIDRSLLTVIPEAPRISQQGFPSHFDWSMFTIDADTDDSNGSQTRMKPFLSQNNLLDNDVNSNNSVSKSKSVHNLTNGTLTDLANDNDVDADIDAATNDNDDDADADNGGAAEVDGQDQGEKNSNEPPEEEEEPAKVNGDIDADTNEEPDYGADEYDEEESKPTTDEDTPQADAVAADENKEEQQDSEQATEENVDEKESVEVADAVENGDVDNGAAESVEEGETEEVSHEKADKSSANVVDRETGVALEKTEVNGTGGEEMTDCQEQDKRANEMNEQEVMSDDREIVDDAKVEMVEKIEDDNANEEKNDAKDEAGDTVENGEISKDSLETNPPEQTVPDDIEQDSLNSPTEIQGTEVVNGEIEHINGTGPPSAKSLKSRKSSAALSTKEIENDSRPTTAMRIGSARSIIEDGNGNTRVLTSAKSTKSEIENIENNNEDVILSRPQSVLNDTGSVKSSATSIKSAKSPTKSMGSSRSSAKSKAGSAQSTVSNRINSAVSMKSETNVKASQPEEKILENGIEANGSRPSTANSVKSASTRTRSGTSQTPSASTVRSNHSAQSVVKQRPDTSATKSATSLKSRPKETDDEDDDKSDSNDDSNQADVQIVHIKNSDEELVDDSNQSNGPPTAKMTNDDDQIGSQNETTPSAKTEIDEPIVEPKAIVETQTGTGNGEPDPDKPEDASNNGNTESNNEDGNNNDNGNIPKAESPSTALEIQGTVQGEPDGGQLHSAQPSASDPDQSNAAVPIQEVIDRGDMEQLAVIVLSGSGGKLLGRRADLPEIQAFLDNVPSYMNKIRRVHMAAREGSLRELQSALDRRKFATAKDQISPHGATPLHVATIFGQSGIVRYLAGRFPETMTATDDNGRTPLHYAATLKDNGHFYNLLTHLGANSKAEDNLNHPAEFYLDHEGTKDLLSHRQLLLDYGAEEDLADEMLNDQELSNSQVEIPLFRTEEGRYLATSLGDPLIKGLTEVANKRPADPITYLANYLFNFANQNQGQLPATGGNKTSAGADRSADQKQDLNNNRNSIEFGVQEDTEEELESSVNKIGPKPLANGMMAAAKPLDDPEQEQGELSPDIAPSSENRDEHGQSMLHFACARSHGRNALIQLIEESGVSLTYRDELYRTARDVSLQASQPDNAKEIDRYVLGLAARGDLDGLNAMLLDGYDHIVDVAGSDGTTIMQVASTRGHREIVRFLETARDFEEKRETLLTAIREKNSPKVMELLEQPDGAKLAKAKNYYGRCSLHIAVLMENEDLVDFLASRFKSTLKVGDNLERTALHYAMGIGNVEAISRILIKNGAKRVLKDLKGRQPSYYFMNKADILRLQEEEKE
ncbi:uncharacterized protein LOC129741846 isoform X7 [Uranotaenia lowii]|uniref:uncharacterized protein LOC129741846 isoform X7 n=1 Tax=Uranotaenia lowii TaxID=190385 RepID=UPI00247AD074|nr:uncharacterized protein LOC129741846 isoform X7 [Uranotaenia lowii]